jgi:hypothetical protein
MFKAVLPEISKKCVRPAFFDEKITPCMKN